MRGFGRFGRHGGGKGLWDGLVAKTLEEGLLGMMSGDAEVKDIGACHVA